MRCKANLRSGRDSQVVEVVHQLDLRLSQFRLSVLFRVNTAIAESISGILMRTDMEQSFRIDSDVQSKEKAEFAECKNNARNRGYRRNGRGPDRCPFLHETHRQNSILIVFLLPKIDPLPK